MRFTPLIYSWLGWRYTKTPSGTISCFFTFLGVFTTNKGPLSSLCCCWHLCYFIMAMALTRWSPLAAVIAVADVAVADAATNAAFMCDYLHGWVFSSLRRAVCGPR